MNNQRWRAAAAMLSCAVAAAGLLMPLPPAFSNLWMQGMGGAGHVLLFALLAWILGRAGPPNRPGWRLWLGLAAFAAAAEIIQPGVGRSAEWQDWFCGAAGAAVVTGMWAYRRRWRWAGLGLVVLLPVAWQGILIFQEWRAFPVLAAPPATWSQRGWTVNGGRLSHGRRAELVFYPRAASNPDYPGLFRTPVVRNWSRAGAFEMKLYWPEATSAVFAVRIDDRPGNPAYGDRFQMECSVTQGWNAIQIPANLLARTSGGRPLCMDKIDKWGVFLVSGPPFDYFSIGDIRLNMSRERP